MSTYDAAADEPPRRATFLQILLLVTTAATTTVAGSLWFGLGSHDVLPFLLDGLPFSAAFLGILLTHEAGHYAMCRYHGVSASLPYLLPAPPILFPFGTFGAFIRIRSRFPDRRALFDIGAAGPWAGFVVALVLLVVGLAWSTPLSGPLPDEGWAFGDSLLTSFLTRVVLGIDPSTPLDVHPFALAGWLGMLVTSLNLLPAGQLDGGHILYAAFRRSTRVVPVVLVGVLLWLGWTGWPGWLVWAAIIVVLVGLRHPPTLDDLRPLCPARTFGAFMSMLLFAVTFIPEPFRLLP
jgi:membrane-associated protease RseP (regulator of RpoE activity)